jgi:spermidine synthase
MIGGLGMGYTLRAALDALPAAAALDVLELSADVIAWNRAHLAALAGAPLDDRRVRLVTGDVAAAIAAAPAGSLHGLALDVDNGPDALVARRNAGLYGARGLAAAHRALAPGGLLGVWSAFASPPFTSALRRAGFDVTIEPVRAYPGGGARHTLWLARRQATAPAPAYAGRRRA